MNETTTPSEAKPVRWPKHCILDLETLGTAPGAIILSIGAVLIDETGILDRFYETIDPRSCEMIGMKCDASTALWWMRQDAAARGEFQEVEDAGLPITAALRDFSDWMPDEYIPVWGNVADFDNALLERAYQLADVPKPWRYCDNRCLRTLRNVHPQFELPLFPEGKVKHHALNDAEHEAEILLAILKHLNP